MPLWLFAKQIASKTWMVPVEAISIISKSNSPLYLKKFATKNGEKATNHDSLKYNFLANTMVNLWLALSWTILDCTILYGTILDWITWITSILIRIDWFDWRENIRPISNRHNCIWQIHHHSQTRFIFGSLGSRWRFSNCNQQRECVLYLSRLI